MQLLGGFDLNNFWKVLLLLFGCGLSIALMLMAWVIWRVKRVDIPPGSDLFTTLRATPFSVVLLLDLLDFSLDFLSAPISWPLLGFLGLNSLRGVTIVEGLIPGTQLLPTMTFAWIAARLIQNQ